MLSGVLGNGDRAFAAAVALRSPSRASSDGRSAPPRPLPPSRMEPEMADSEVPQRQLPSPAGDLLAGGPDGLPETPAVGDLIKGLPIDGLT